MAKLVRAIGNFPLTLLNKVDGTNGNTKSTDTDSHSMAESGVLRHRLSPSQQADYETEAGDSPTTTSSTGIYTPGTTDNELTSHPDGKLANS